MSTSSPSSETVPQAATSLLDVCVDAVLASDLDQPIDEWLKERHELSASARRQVASILLFLNLLGQRRQVVAEARQWRADRRTLCEALAMRIRRAYAAAGCQKSQADLIGSPLLSKESIGRLLQFEPPFQRLANSDTRNNAIRFACHLHEAIARGKLAPSPECSPDAPRPDAPVPREAPHARPDAPAFHDQGAIINPKRYRVARVQGDLWIYANVHFERPEGARDLSWLDSLTPADRARWLEQLAAALLDEADALRGQNESDSLTTL